MKVVKLEKIVIIKALVTIMWFYWLYLTINILTRDQVDEGMLITKMGTLVSAERFSTRTSYGISYKALFKGEEKEYLGKINTDCNEKDMQQFNESVAKVAFYNNRSIAIKIDNVDVVSISDGLKKINKNYTLIIFSFLICFSCSFFYYLWVRRK